MYVNTSSSVGPSTVAGAIFEKGGRGYQEKLVQKTGGSMKYGDVAVTEGGGNLRCKAVYHACLHEKPLNQEEVNCFTPSHLLLHSILFSSC